MTATRACRAGATAANIANLEKFLCFLGLTIAHEVVHLLYGRINDDPLNDTPPKVNDPPRIDPKRGETGRVREKLFFGYRIEPHWDPTDPLGTTQAGAFYAMESGKTNGWKVTQGWIKQAISLGEYQTIS